jgi:hypothetical protein
MMVAGASHCLFRLSGHFNMDLREKLRDLSTQEPIWNTPEPGKSRVNVSQLLLDFEYVIQIMSAISAEWQER